MTAKSSQTTGLNRDPVDKYYTNLNCVNLCINLVKKHIKFNPLDLIIEPSAGNGAFINAIKKIGTKCQFYDISPDTSADNGSSNHIVQLDFLQFNDVILDHEYKTHIIGNPPFGRQSSTAIKFIKKCCEFADSISFILPKSFKKESMRKHFHKNYHLICEVDLPDYSFLIDNKPVDVPCIFQIWMYLEIERIPICKLEPIGYTFVKKNENHNISFRRVGVNAGSIFTNIDSSEQSHYFIRFDNFSSSLFNELKKIKYKTDNTVGPKSISRQELILEFNEVIKNISATKTTSMAKILNKINARINREICHVTIAKLSDDNLMCEYMKSPSVLTKVEEFTDILKLENINEVSINNILKKTIPKYFIPAGTKGNIRGSIFNNIVWEYILALKLSDYGLYAKVESHCEFVKYKTDEIPDWYIYQKAEQKAEQKVMIGMNQIGLWGGGAQSNRGCKYLNTITPTNIKLVCVVCEYKIIKTDKNKIFQLFEKGYTNDTLCYLNGLKRIIYEFFGLDEN